MEWKIEYLMPILAVMLFVFLYTYKKFKKDPEALTGKYSTERAYSKSTEGIEGRIGKALMNAGFNNVRSNDDLRSYSASTGLTLWSFGENIAVRSTVLIDQQTVHFGSVCVYPFQIADWAKNRRNSTKFFKELDALMA